jgi:hypothetical protein
MPESGGILVGSVARGAEPIRRAHSAALARRCTVDLEITDVRELQAIAR